MTPAQRSSGIVLAGGRSRRFGSDKLEAIVAGRPVLALAVAAVRAVCDEVIVARAHDGIPPLDIPDDVVEVRDLEPDGGPLAGLLSGAREASHDRLLLVGGDMPWLVPDVLRLLLRTLDGTTEAVALGLGPDDRVQPLPLALSRPAVLAPTGSAAVPDGRALRSLRGLLGALETAVLAERVWRPLDPDASSLLDVDTPGDLPRG